jgi:hypothetical protein
VWEQAKFSSLLEASIAQEQAVNTRRVAQKEVEIEAVKRMHEKEKARGDEMQKRAGQNASAVTGFIVRCK